jgi:hypothetical protein
MPRWTVRRARPLGERDRGGDAAGRGAGRARFDACVEEAVLTSPARNASSRRTRTSRSRLVTAVDPGPARPRRAAGGRVAVGAHAITLASIAS